MGCLVVKQVLLLLKIPLNPFTISSSNNHLNWITHCFWKGAIFLHYLKCMNFFNSLRVKIIFCILIHSHFQNVNASILAIDPPM